MQGPLYDSHEMGNTRAGLLAKINALPAYRPLFSSAFTDAKAGIRLDHIYLALTAFETSLVSLNSRYDLYAQGIHDALSPKEIEGMNVFRSFVARCAECHTPPLFTNQQVAVLGTPEPEGRRIRSDGLEAPRQSRVIVCCAQDSGTGAGQLACNRAYCAREGHG